MKNNQTEFALLFDMDGTLMDSNPTHKEAYRAFLKKYSIDLTDDDFEKYISGRMNPDIMKHFFGKDVSYQKITALTREKEALFQSAFQEKIKPIRGLLPFLKQVREAGIRTALATSAPMINVTFMFDHIPIRDCFDVIVCDRDVKVGKPEPGVFQVAAKKLKMDPARCIVFEDSPAGLEAAQKAGAKVIMLTTSKSAAELKGADLVIDAYDELSITKLTKLMN